MLVLTNLGVIAGALAGTVPPRYAVWLAGGSSIAYTLARSIVKAGSS